MLRVHTTTGQTTSYDLSNDNQASKLFNSLKQRSYQKTITGITLSANGCQYSMSRPKGFKGVFFQYEHIEPSEDGRVKGGGRITCFAGGVRLVCMIHKGGCVRVDLAHVGNQVYNPIVDSK